MNKPYNGLLYLLYVVAQKLELRIIRYNTQQSTHVVLSLFSLQSCQKRPQSL